jgi:hypothetical protein
MELGAFSERQVKRIGPALFRILFAWFVSRSSAKGPNNPASQGCFILLRVCYGFIASSMKVLSMDCLTSACLALG